MDELIPEGKTRILLVEGSDDRVFFDRFVNHLAETSDAQFNVTELSIIEYGGRDKLTLRLRELKKADNFELVTHMGIVRDSDFNTDAFRSVQDRIKTVNNDGPPHIQVPNQPSVPSANVPQVSVLIVPSVEREGMLDDLVMEALTIDPIASCVNEYFNCLQSAEVQVVPERETKAKIRTFLIAKNVDRATAVSGITDRLFLSDAYETSLWQEHHLWESPALQETRDFLTQLLD